MDERTWVRGDCDTSACIEVWDSGTGIVNLRTSWSHQNAMQVLEEEWEAFKEAVKAGKFD